MSAAAERSVMTPEAFLAWEQEQPDRHEFIDGEVYAMTGGTTAHTEIGLNLVLALRSRLPTPCRVYHSDMKVKTDTNFFYPDVVVQCRPRAVDALFLQHPALIAEVLSASTAHYDEHTKWPLYQRIPTLQTFLLVAQDQPMVHHYRRHGAAWLYTCHTALADLLELSEPALTLPLRELYAGIDGIDPAVPRARD